MQQVCGFLFVCFLGVGCCYFGFLFILGAPAFLLSSQTRFIFFCKIHVPTCSVEGLHVLCRNLHLQQFHELMSSLSDFLQLPSVHQM